MIRDATPAPVSARLSAPPFHLPFPVVAARASTHILFSVATALAVKKGMSFPKALFLVGLPLHAISEGLVVIPFGIPIEGALICIVGAAIHHTIDSMISIIILRAVRPLIRSIFK
jgi:hypothetical protein